jgi:hypothetical protein
MSHENNSLCELCELCENSFVPMPCLGGVYWVNQHCIDLRRNREARESKNYKPTKTVF